MALLAGRQQGGCSGCGGSSGGGCCSGGGRRRRRQRQAVNQNCVLRQALVFTDVSWQLAKDADGPEGKMKNTRKFGFSEHELRTRNRQFKKFNMIRNGHRESNHNTFLRHGENEKKYLDNSIYRF